LLVFFGEDIYKIITLTPLLYRIPKGQATVLVVGGALEAANSDKDCIRLVLHRRKGFVKLALRCALKRFSQTGPQTHFDTF
jgi:hypothetical protein